MLALRAGVNIIHCSIIVAAVVACIVTIALQIISNSSDMAYMKKQGSVIIVSSWKLPTCRYCKREWNLCFGLETIQIEDLPFCLSLLI